MKKLSKKELRIHAFCWSIYIFMEVVLAWAMTGKFSNPLHYFFFYVLNIGMFYFHSLWIMPILYSSTSYRKVRFSLGLLSEILLYLGAASLINLLLTGLGQRATALVFNIRYIGVTIWRATFFIMYGTGFFFLKNYLKKKDMEMQKALEIERLRLQLITAEKDFLRSQINPHLLFNTLNFIKNATRQNPGNARKAITGLSDLMEYALEDSKNDVVSLARELEQVENMIQLNQLRFEQQLNMSYIKEISDGQAEIIPIVLLTLVENIFKHGIFNDPDYPAIIEVRSSNGEIYFATSNLTKYSGEKRGSCTGLSNISARLAPAYPGRYSFEYGMNGANFETELKISLQSMA